MSTTEGSVDLRRAPASFVATWKYSLITYNSRLLSQKYMLFIHFTKITIILRIYSLFVQKIGIQDKELHQ